MTFFFVAGTPAPQGSKSFKGVSKSGKGILVESSKAVKPWRELIAETARWNRQPILDGAVHLKLDFVMPRPKATPKSRTPQAVKRPDLDKLVRAVMDALTGIAWADDSQVVQISARKFLAFPLEPTPGVYINYEPIPERLAA